MCHQVVTRTRHARECHSSHCCLIVGADPQSLEHLLFTKPPAVEKKSGGRARGGGRWGRGRGRGRGNRAADRPRYLPITTKQPTEFEQQMLPTAAAAADASAQVLICSSVRNVVQSENAMLFPEAAVNCRHLDKSVERQEAAVSVILGCVYHVRDCFSCIDHLCMQQTMHVCMRTGFTECYQT